MVVISLKHCDSTLEKKMPLFFTAGRIKIKV